MNPRSPFAILATVLSGSQAIQDRLWRALRSAKFEADIPDNAVALPEPIRDVMAQKKTPTRCAT